MEKFCFLFWLSLSCLAYSETRYVVKNNPQAAAPYTNWLHAAATIQAAVDVSVFNDTIWVTNGVYDTGGRTANGALTNRVAITNAVVVRSVNGPDVTFIKGAGPVGDAAVRCVYLGANAALIGFKLTNGHTHFEMAHPPPLPDGCGGGVFCEPSAVLSNCVLTGNSAASTTSGGGGGAYDGTLYNCILIGNSAYTGSGGGTYNSILYNCILTGNSAYNCGGGACRGTLYNCTLTGNSAVSSGGGAFLGTLYNSIIYYNTAPNSPNFVDSPYCTLNYCCTTPTPDPGGVGNITNEPLLTGVSHLSEGSPCIDGGHAAYASGTDIDGETWSLPPSIGCDEYHMGSVTGLLSVAIAAYTNVRVGFPVVFTAVIEGRTTASRWEFGNGIVISNHIYASHTWPSTGVYPVVLTAWNESHPQGVSATADVAVIQAVHYVRAGNPTPVFPFVTWETAADNIQDAVDAATTAGALVLVTNGVYDTGGWPANGALTNRVAIGKPLVVRSVNGPDVTFIKGAGPVGDAAVRCVYLGANAALIGFKLTNGHTFVEPGYPPPPDGCGGGVFCEPSAVLSNCILTGNSAGSYGGGAAYGTLYDCTLTNNSSGQYGGGASGGMLYNCTLTGNSTYFGGGAFFCTLYTCTLTSNSVDGSGGGAYDAMLYNCTLTGNSAYWEGGGMSYGTSYNCTLTGNSATQWGGGTYHGAVYNCIVYYNVAPSGPNFRDCTLNYCCTTPEPGGMGNITNEPLFVDYAGGDLRLQSNSPCVNMGTNQDWMAGSTDLDGNPRIRRSRVDMGAYESDYWGQFSDLDGDGLSDWIEVYRTGTDPTNAASCLGMGTPLDSDTVGTGIVVRWQSVADKTYRLARTTNLMEDFLSLSNRLNATPPMNVYTDRTVTGWGPWYYRVGVE